MLGEMLNLEKKFFQWYTKKLKPEISQVRCTGFFLISNSFICNARLKLAKNQANAKQHPEAELLLFENYSHFSSTLSSKSNRTYSKKQAKEQVCLYLRDYRINHDENEDENEK